MYKLKMEKDCNLAFYFLTKKIWETKTKNLGFNCYCILDTNQNFFIYDDIHNIIWTSNTNSKITTESAIIIEDIGKISLYNTLTNSLIKQWP
ncbi:hypothetical protein SELMODRAFT_105409 [Selaginella moellendorffii]|uniref:Bulb-type lectin domain-containing protein n=1 Tax=Selaginella moellendorffii TaxID=88036 RepID=D8S085_SELML|nr:hypothetical protein SELMODRAFT_105409 [Selaginella moellendorffii]